jgi:endonuclease YncB( thermonuclease family)
MDSLKFRKNFERDDCRIMRDSENKIEIDNRRITGKYIVIFFISVFFQVAAVCAEFKCLEKGTVTWIVDGDTIIVKLYNKSEKVRLLGIDTPEFHKKGGKNDYYAYEAFLYTKKQLKGKTVCLVKDPPNSRDKYGRLLRYVYVNGKLFNAELVREGYAEIYHKGDHSKKILFSRLEDEARRAGRGIWKVRK